MALLKENASEILASKAVISTDKNANSKTADPEIVAEKKETKKKFTSGPKQPEMRSFQSVNANNLVDLFTGDFFLQYTITGCWRLSGKPALPSGITMDQEASW